MKERWISQGYVNIGIIQQLILKKIQLGYYHTSHTKNDFGQIKDVGILNILFMYLFLALLGLHCCAAFSWVAASRGYSIAAVHRLLVAVAPLVAEHRLQACRLHSHSSQSLKHELHSCGARAQLLHGMWDLPRPGTESMAPDSLLLSHQGSPKM